MSYFDTTAGVVKVVVLLVGTKVEIFGVRIALVDNCYAERAYLTGICSSLSIGLRYVLTQSNY